MGGGGGKPPEKSTEERELQAEQLRGLRDQRAMLSEQLRMQDLMAPFLYEQSGLKPRMEGGRVIGFDKVDDTLDPMRREIEKLSLERSQKALRGELGIDPALERGIGENRRLLESTLAQQLGPGFATSTPGMQALATEGQRAEELRAGSRRGELTLSEALGLNRGEANAAMGQRRMANLAASLQIPGASREGSTNYLNALAQTLQGFQQDRSMGVYGPKKSRLAGAAGGAMAGAALGSLAGPGYGTAIGAGIGGIAGLFM